MSQVKNKKNDIKFDYLLSKTDVEQCCINKSIYEITYSLGTKWLVCNECLELEFFQTDIKEKVRIIH